MIQWNKWDGLDGMEVSGQQQGFQRVIFNDLGNGVFKENNKNFHDKNYFQ